MVASLGAFVDIGRNLMISLRADERLLLTGDSYGHCCIILLDHQAHICKFQLLIS